MVYLHSCCKTHQLINIKVTSTSIFYFILFHKLKITIVIDGQTKDATKLAIIHNVTALTILQNMLMKREEALGKKKLFVGIPAS